MTNPDHDQHGASAALLMVCHDLGSAAAGPRGADQAHDQRWETVETPVSAVLRKLQWSNRRGLACWAQARRFGT